MDVSGQGCDTTTFNLVNAITDNEYQMKIVQTTKNRYSRLSFGEPALMSVPAGTYKIMSGTCSSHGYQDLNYAFIDKWFEPFEVANGDVNYLGSLNVSAAKGETHQSTGDEVVTRLLGMGLNKKPIAQYGVYNFIELESRAKQALVLNYPDLADNLEYAPPQARINARDFRRFVAKTYEPDSEGKKPKAKDARKVIENYVNSGGIEPET